MGSTIKTEMVLQAVISLVLVVSSRNDVPVENGRLKDQEIQEIAYPTKPADSCITVSYSTYLIFTIGCPCWSLEGEIFFSSWNERWRPQEALD